MDCGAYQVGALIWRVLYQSILYLLYVFAYKVNDDRKHHMQSTTQPYLSEASKQVCDFQRFNVTLFVIQANVALKFSPKLHDLLKLLFWSCLAKVFLFKSFRTQSKNNRKWNYTLFYKNGEFFHRGSTFLSFSEMSLKHS